MPTVIAYVGVACPGENTVRTVEFNGVQLAAFRPRHGAVAHALYKTDDGRLIVGIKELIPAPGLEPGVRYRLTEMDEDMIRKVYPGLAEAAQLLPSLTLDEALAFFTTAR